MQEVRLQPASLDALAGVVSAERLTRLDRSAVRLREQLDGRAIVNVSSTAVGGGVAEMLRWMLPYGRGLGVDTRWFVLDADPELFTITKRIHQRIHGVCGDDGPLGPDEAEHLRAIGRANAAELGSAVEPGDVLLVHDPQPIGLFLACASWRMPMVWRCHIGSRTSNEYTDQAWDFLRSFLEPDPDAYVFTSADYAPSWVPADRLTVVRPSIDPLSPKNRSLPPDRAVDVLRHVGILSGGSGVRDVGFTRSDGTPGRVLRFADIIRTGPAPATDAPLVVQVSRWDYLKDMPGVMEAFVDHVLDGTDAHLVLAGPVVTSVADDPTAGAELQRAWNAWRALSHRARSRVQLVCVPMADPEENATIVNALQSHATVVTQKSLAEGFGLTVTEAMFKHSAVVASRVGGIVDQITDGVDGCLVEPGDLRAFGATVAGLLVDPERRRVLGDRAHAKVVSDCLPDTALDAWADVIVRAIGNWGRSCPG